MKRWCGSAWAICIALLLISSNVPALDRVKRQMYVNRVSQIGLEVWTEEQPRWQTYLESKAGQYTFAAETPDLTYPPAGFTWSSAPTGVVEESDFKTAALGAIHGSARGYGVNPNAIPASQLRSATYGELSGYEVSFAGSIQQTPVDVKVFVGHQPGKPLVVMQACTQRGHLPHISEQIRRSWTHVRYLKH